MLAEEGMSGSQPPAKAALVIDDVVLVERSRKGDMQAFGTLVTKYQDRIYNLVLRMVGRASDAEELAQETFLRALERLSQFRGGSQFYTWLFRVAANLAISHRRRGGKVRFQSMTGPDDGDENQSAALTAGMAQRREARPDDAAQSAEVNRRVMRALEELDDEFRLVVFLRDMEDMDYAEIADVLELPVGTIKSRIHRARSMLKEKLADLAP